MFKILIKRVFRSKIAPIMLGLLMVMGVISIITGRLFLNEQEATIEHTIAYQQKHLETQIHLHNDDLGLLLYYLKFSYIKPLTPLAGISIGQSDLHTNVQHVTMLNLEGQKYNTDLINPVRLQVGNLDLAFTLIFLFPLVIIGLMFNILSGEIEGGTWTLIKIQGHSPIKYLLSKTALHLLSVSISMVILLLIAMLAFEIPITSSFLSIVGLSFAYILFWFGLSFGIALFRMSSKTNAIVLLSIWMIITILAPAIANNYINHQYPIDDAFTMAIKQRDAYHTKWDMDKKPTMDKFYAHYPQFSNYELQEEGFSWLWYYAMQQMGDDESITEKQALYDKIKNRELLSNRLAKFIPSLQVQLSMNNIAATSLTDHIDFLNATTDWHEDIRLQLYPKIFDGKSADDVEWSLFKPAYFESSKRTSQLMTIFSILIITIVGLLLSFLMNGKHFP